MKSRILRLTVLLSSLILITQVSTQIFEEDHENDFQPDIISLNDQELIRQMHSIMNAYREKYADGDRLVVETNSLVNTKFKTLKRNADLINALLALPKGMTDAGR